MRIDKVYIEDFKNLKRFCIDLDENQMNTVLLGQNATGKSNFIEALVKIFKYLDLSSESSRKYPEFKYWIKYNCYEKDIIIDYTSNTYKIEIEGKDKSPSFKDFFSSEGKKLYFPKYVFTYYSGISNRLDEVFWEHQNNFYKKIIRADFNIEELDDIRKLFYVKPIHSFFVLLAFFSLSKIETKSKQFLLNVLGIEDLESVLFVIKKAFWAKKDNEKFWGAEGLVKDFLNTLWDYSLAPIYEDKSVDIDFRRQETQKRLYLFIKDKNRLKEFAKKYFSINNEKPSNTFLFKALESTYISDMLEEVKVRVKKRKDGGVTFKELSEGEQQLLTVIGLLIFTREDESLVLLDEPDTHLNPIWKYDYLYYLKSLVKSKNKLETGEDSDELEEDKTTQVIINTHDPLVIGSMVKSQVRLFGKEKIPPNDNTKPKDKYEELKQQALSFAIEPDVDPQGLGVAGILRSELFGLKTILDRETNKLLDERNRLMYKQSKNDITEESLNRLEELFELLSNKGFSHNYRDPLFNEYIIEKMKKMED